MTYVVYADVLFLYHCLVNVTLLCMIQTILGQSIKILRTCMWTIFMAALSTGIFLITISLCIICHKLLFYDIFSYKTRAISDSNVENDTGRACWLYMVGWNAAIILHSGRHSVSDPRILSDMYRFGIGMPDCPADI